MTNSVKALQPCVKDRDFWCDPINCCLQVDAKKKYLGIDSTPNRDPITTMKKPNTKCSADDWAKCQTPDDCCLDSQFKSTDPEHYKLPIEPWDYIIANNMNFLEGNVIKYVSRYKKKGGREDLLKARTYLDKLIEITT